MGVLIGNASINENNDITNGVLGDQTGKEVCIREWYPHGWTDVVRPNSRELANKIANLMEQACNNNKIGYAQDNRLSLYKQAIKLNFDISKINVQCDCDCSSLVAVCVIGAGVDINPDIYTGNEVSALKATGLFKVLRKSQFTDSSSYLERGDILVKQFSHTAIVLTDGAKVLQSNESIKINTADYFDEKVSGIYRAKTDVYMRCGAGRNYRSVKVLNEGEVCRCYGYYSLVGKTKWLYVKRMESEGFISSTYLKKE